MPDDEGRNPSEDKKATENVLTQKFGPLPLFVWVAIAAGAIGAIFILKRNSSGGSSSVQSVPVATGVAGGPAPSGDTSGGGTATGPDLSQYATTASVQQDVTGLSAQVQTLSDTIASQLKSITANETTLGTGISNLNQQVGGLGQQVGGLGNTVNSLSGQVQQTASQVGGFQSQLNNTQSSINSLVQETIPNIENQIHANTQA